MRPGDGTRWRQGKRSTVPRPAGVAVVVALTITGIFLVYRGLVGVPEVTRPDPQPTPEVARPVAAEGAPNILVVTLCSVRADRVSGAGYSRETTPNMDALAANGVRFSSAYTNAPSTLPAHASLLTGLLPDRHGVIDFQTRLSREIPSLPAVLGLYGYRTTWVTQTENSGMVLKGLGEAQGFFRGFESQMTTTGTPQSLARFGAWVADEQVPFFALVLLRSAHLPYGDGRPFVAALDPRVQEWVRQPAYKRIDGGEGKAEEWLDGSTVAERTLEFLGDLSVDTALQVSLDAASDWSVLVAPGILVAPVVPAPAVLAAFLDRRVRPPIFRRNEEPPIVTGIEEGEHLAGKELDGSAVAERTEEFLAALSVDTALRASLDAAYDSGVREVDEVLGNLLDTLRASGALDHTIIVVVGDHGEALGDDGEIGHGNSLHDSVIRVPMLVSLPGGDAGGREVRADVSLVDLLPTLLELAGATAPAMMDGRSLVPLLEGDQEWLAQPVRVQGVALPKGVGLVQPRTVPLDSAIAEVLASGPYRVELHPGKQDVARFRAAGGSLRALTEEETETITKMQDWRTRTDAARATRVPVRVQLLEDVVEALQKEGYW